MNQKSKLAAKTRELLLHSEIRSERIAADCEVTMAWLMRFRSKFGETEAPSVDRIERLYEYLSGKVIEV